MLILAEAISRDFLSVGVVSSGRDVATGPRFSRSPAGQTRSTVRLSHLTN